MLLHISAQHLLNDSCPQGPLISYRQRLHTVSPIINNTSSLRTAESPMTSMSLQRAVLQCVNWQGVPYCSCLMMKKTTRTSWCVPCSLRQQHNDALCSESCSVAQWPGEDKQPRRPCIALCAPEATLPQRSKLRDC